MPRNTDDKTKTTATSIVVNKEVKTILDQAQERLTGTFGFKPSLGQTLTHILTKDKQPENV